MEALLDLGGVGDLEAEGGKPDCPGSGGADLQEVAAGNLGHNSPVEERALSAPLKIRVPCRPVNRLELMKSPSSQTA
jgi:hypothetical protein